MRELVKKMALASLGTAVVSTSKVRETMQALVEQGKLTSEEAERFTQELFKTGEEEMHDIRNQVSSGFDRLTKGMNLAHAEEVQALHTQMANLEKRLNILEDQVRSQEVPAAVESHQDPDQSSSA